jgi:hypothetical protein
LLNSTHTHAKLVTARKELGGLSRADCVAACAIANPSVQVSVELYNNLTGMLKLLHKVLARRHLQRCKSLGIHIRYHLDTG